jgi:hypothetical protein
MTRPARPDFIIMGAPKAGTTALHAALTRHPDVFMSDPKEPKYWMCDDAPPPHWSGPGDQHSQREWVWRRSDYERLFEPAAPSAMRGESTPFYLWHRAAQRRIAEHLPEARLIAVVRDPIDRAYSNWMHLWSDGLDWTDRGEVLRGRPGEWDARGARVTTVVGHDPLTVLSDGRPDAESNWIETTGVAVWDDGDGQGRLVPDPTVSPIRSPYADGAFRYAAAVPLGDGRTRYFVEAAREDGAHDLVTMVR